jgi:opacity protein-like surface antigen
MSISYRFRSCVFIFIGLVACINAAQAYDSSPKKKQDDKPMGIYFGGFGGGGFFSADVAQKGTAFFSQDAGGPLSVNAVGDTNASWFGFGGLHLGYEWLGDPESSWHFTPGVELEGYYFSKTKTADLDNPAERLDFHLFTDTFPMRTGVILASGILALTNHYVTPYVGLGIGSAMISIHGADSTQTDPPEPGVNHFNSDPDAFDWSFAVQAKGGLRYQLFKYMRLFGEYRFLYVTPTNFTFGSTQYPGHVATSSWKVRLSDMYYNLFSVGIDFTF